MKRAALKRLSTACIIGFGDRTNWNGSYSRTTTTNFSFSFSSGLAAVWGCRASPPLLWGGGGGVNQHVTLAIRMWGPTYIASYTQHTGLLGRLHHEVLQLLMWWRSLWPFGQATEFSCAAFSSPPSPILELRHNIHPKAETTLTPSGGRSFIAATHATGHLEE